MNENALKEINLLDYERHLNTLEDDKRVLGIFEYFNSKNIFTKEMKVLEIGTLDGYHTCMLAKRFKHITCTDVRPQGLHRALFRCLFKNIDNVNFKLLDADTMHNEIEQNEYDLIFHSGVFYHLSNPVEHLENISQLAEFILLETHIANYDKYEAVNLNGYDGTLYPEGNWIDLRAAKDNNKSFWLNRVSLKQLIQDCNLRIVHTIYEHQPNEHGERVCYLLQRGNNEIKLCNTNI
jgi:tRNA (mo5U34)-methyltransferase